MSRELALELDQHGNAIEHPRTARVVYRLNLPMLPKLQSFSRLIKPHDIIFAF